MGFGGRWSSEHRQHSAASLDTLHDGADGVFCRRTFSSKVYRQHRRHEHLIDPILQRPLNSPRLSRRNVFPLAVLRRVDIILIALSCNFPVHSIRSPSRTSLRLWLISASPFN